MIIFISPFSFINLFFLSFLFMSTFWSLLPSPLFSTLFRPDPDYVILSGKLFLLFFFFHFFVFITGDPGNPPLLLPPRGITPLMRSGAGCEHGGWIWMEGWMMANAALTVHINVVNGFLRVTAAGRDHLHFRSAKTEKHQNLRVSLWPFKCYKSWLISFLLVDASMPVHTVCYVCRVERMNNEDGWRCW